MSEASEHLGMREVEEEDAEHYGVKGMKWGVRRSKAQLASASKSGESSSTTKSDGPETSAQRYSRLRETAKSGKAGGLSDEDLKWFNARTEALAKINKMNQQDPKWINKTLNEVLKNVAKTTLQGVIQDRADAHVRAPLKPKAIDKK